jgi:hypothetical protein
MTRFLPALLIITFLAAGCGEDDASPTGPSVPVFDEITVSLDEISIVQDCDGGNGGEFAYMFYVVTEEDGEEVETYLDTTYTSFTGTNYLSWDPGLDVTFTLERKPGSAFRVRMRMRELDSTEDFSEGINVWHTIEDGQPAWSPGGASSIDGYTLYDASKKIGLLDWEFNPRADCRGNMTYTVQVAPASS